jgi:pyridoxine/pyridoxamine 5'-phosphate oxidase
VEQLEQQAWAELCWYFPDSREQFRVAGKLTLVGEDYPDDALRKAGPVLGTAGTALDMQSLRLFPPCCWYA